ncbi:MAG: DUF748 domain-containing protein [Hydrogenophaga sp.]|uniref:DUF748 domain-containing protein n=1 Tax=Hydrogenophaga sp. TaxID=1904254 RepID=UPI003D0E19D5
MNALTRPLSSKPWLRRSFIALGALLLLWAVTWLAVPPLLKWQLQKQASDLLGRAVTVERIEFRPWSLGLTLEGLRVADASGNSAQFSLARLYANAELQSLVRLAPVISALTLEQPRLTLRHLGQGRYDVDDILQRLSPSDNAPASEPSHFALFNIDVAGGELTLADDGTGTTHHLTQFNLGVPFLSNLPSRQEVVTEPRLAFVLNGSAFDSRASTTPFAQTRETVAQVDIPALDLSPYLPYWPAVWPMQPRAGTLHLALRLDFEQQAQPRLALSGKVALSGLQVVERMGTSPDAALLSWERLQLDINRLEPFARVADLASVELLAPRLELARDQQGRLNLARMSAALAALGSPASSPAEAAPPAAPWRVSVARVLLEGGTVPWKDASVRPAADLAVTALKVQAQNVRWPMDASAPFEASAVLGDTPFSLKGSATASEARAELVLGELPLNTLAPYLAEVLVPELDGRLRANLALQWRAGQGGQPMALAIDVPTLQVDALRLGPARRPLASLGALQMRDVRLDLAAHTATVGKLLANRLQASVLRDQGGRWQAQDWLKSSPPVARAEASSPSAPWQVTLADVELDGGSVTLDDRGTVRPVNVAVSQLKLQLKNLQPLASNPPDMPLSLQLRLGPAQAARGEPGKLSMAGSLRLPGAAKGLRLKAKVQADGLPLHELEPYFGDRLNLELLRADASYRGSLEAALPAAGLRLSLAGQASLDDFRANTLSPAEDLLAWKSLQVRGLDLSVVPGQVTRLVVEETVLSDYFARIIIDEAGRINLQGLVKPAQGEATVAASAPAASASAPVAAAAAAEPTADVRFGPVSLVNGRVLFSDRFIKPNYSANLSELTGGLSAFSSVQASGGAPQLGDLTLRGRAEGTAALEIDGKLNPLAKPLALDIRGKVRNLELPPLSPYSVKYAGHGIERGKLSVDVAYKIEPNGQLTASNQIILNQLSFGDRVAGSEAPNLPVKLAVALLADRNGVIDINLPVSGSLNDPQFRLGPLIFRLIFNLIGKAITAPFSLIASAFGGGPEMSQVAFSEGGQALDATGRERLDAVAKALANRPALQVTVVGHADLETERAGYQRARLDQQVLAEKRRALARTGTPPTKGLVVSPEEYPALLKEVYRRADIPKPRNVIGIAKDIPQAEMEALLMAAVPVTPDALRDLAVARAVAVKDYLASRELPEDRLFLGAPQLTRQGENWRPQAELRLAPR